mgnify:CR=1 FL=1
MKMKLIAGVAASLALLCAVPAQAQQKTCLLYTSPSPRDRG